ncbi:Chitinase 1 [Rhizophlyctis rosea]|uniref:Chitinase 1 n=1 Tax=Rhizophlyctis rosea TaxID=64517 RepID=A0AAD5SJT9_9FUNG|nr:Chitinase 1 [Rhizophlyctis rosea]
MRFDGVHLLLSFLPSLTLAALPSPQYHLIGYWGQNFASAQFADSSLQEPSLKTFCQSTSYTIYHVSFMTLHSDVLGNPAIDFSVHCRWPTNKWSGYPNPDPRYGFNSLNCRDVGEDVKACQAMGKKVLISISPSDYLTSTESAIRSATGVWNTFLGGATQYRPLGDAILDGIDMHIWNNDVNGYYTPFVTRLRELMGASLSKTWYVAGEATVDA